MIYEGAGARGVRGSRGEGGGCGKPKPQADAPHRRSGGWNVSGIPEPPCQASAADSGLPGHVRKVNSYLVNPLHFPLCVAQRDTSVMLQGKSPAQCLCVPFLERRVLNPPWWQRGSLVLFTGTAEQRQGSHIMNIWGVRVYPSQKQ